MAELKIKDLKKYHKNPRNITERQFSELSEWLVKYGDLSGIVVNRRTGEIIGGNQRTHFFREKDAEIKINEEFAEPDEQGTTKIGYVILNGKKYSYREVDWDEKWSEQANIIANKAGGTWDYEILANEFDQELLLDSGFQDWELTPEGDSPNNLVIDGKYTQNIAALVYTPKGDKPLVADLFDDVKVKELETEIQNSEATPEIKDFLYYAAQRHRVFKYNKIAEYYAHASPEIQNLMERSALVIIDFNKSIEGGFTKLSENIENQFKDEYEE
jgi:hypothetical protein